MSLDLLVLSPPPEHTSPFFGAHDDLAINYPSALVVTGMEGIVGSLVSRIYPKMTPEKWKQVYEEISASPYGHTLLFLIGEEASAIQRKFERIMTTETELAV